MARKRDQEDAFKPLNDSPADEVEESQGSRRGLEIKIVLLGLILVVAVIGYFGYLKLKPDGGADQEVADANLLNLEGDETVPSQVVPATGVEVTDDALVMTQWNDVSAPESEPETAWTSPKTISDSTPQPIGADVNQSYAANYGGDSLSAPTGSTETTFAPMPNPGNFTAGTAASVPSEATTSAPATPPQSIYGNQVATAEPSPAQPTPIPEQADTTPPGTSGPVATVPEDSQSASGASDFRAASQPTYDSIASAPAATPSAMPTYQAPTESYAPPAPAYVPSSPPASSYALPQQSAPVASTPGPLPYGSPSTDVLPAQESYQPYSHPATTRTHADYAALSSDNEAQALPERWQKPTVVPVDGKYTARPNDNFYTISRKVYGSGAYFEALAKFNAAKYPSANQIRIGDIVETPPVSTLEGRYPELCPKPEHRDAAKRRSTAVANQSLAGRRVYVVQEGDNLFDIARFELGARSKVADLIELNRDVLGDHINYLTPGMRLVLPETNDRGPTVTQGPTNTLR